LWLHDWLEERGEKGARASFSKKGERVKGGGFPKRSTKGKKGGGRPASKRGGGFSHLLPLFERGKKRQTKKKKRPGMVRDISFEKRGETNEKKKEASRRAEHLALTARKKEKKGRLFLLIPLEEKKRDGE